MLHIMCRQGNANRAKCDTTTCLLKWQESGMLTSNGEVGGATGTLACCWWEAKGCGHFGKTVWRFLIQLNTLLPYGLALTLSGIYPKELKIDVHTKVHSCMFVVVLFIARTWKQPGCPSVAAWINTPWYVQTMEYYSTLRRNELPSHEVTGRDLSCI